MFDKFAHYEKAVQDAPALCDFLENAYRWSTGKEARTLREDFAGSFSISREWVTRGDGRFATVIDNDAAPLAYGKKQLLSDDRSKVRILKRDVLKGALPKADLACAFNFSYCVFHDRARLKKYFRSAGKALALDCLSGPETAARQEMRVDYGGFTYVWEQAEFDPVSRRALFLIHFERPGEKTRRNVFRYDWRLWTVPELRDLLMECGYRDVRVFWQGAEPIDDPTARRRMPANESWDGGVAYLLALRSAR